MANTYKPVSEYGRAIYGDDAFEAEFSVIDERDLLSSGHLEIVPRAYRVLSDNYAAGKQGDEFAGAFPVEQEAALIQGGHIKRVDAESASTKKKG